MFNFLERLRRRPEYYRRGVAFLGSLAITLAIGVVWGTVIFPGSVSQNAQANVISKNSPFATFKKNIGSSFGAVKEQWGEVKGLLNQTSYDAPEETALEESDIPSTSTVIY